jgi:hypothetical protein
VCHACQAFHHNAQGYGVGVPHPKGMKLKYVLKFTSRLKKENDKVNGSNYNTII